VSVPVRYSFGPLERRGLLGPLPATSAGCLVLGVLTAITLLDRTPSPAGLLEALVTLTTCAAVGLLPVRGRPVAEWGPLAIAHLARRAVGRHRLKR
jgi:hypothetical protein